jgi:hypothetical protein
VSSRRRRCRWPHRTETEEGDGERRRQDLLRSKRYAHIWAVRRGFGRAGYNQVARVSGFLAEPSQEEFGRVDYVQKLENGEEKTGSLAVSSGKS